MAAALSQTEVNQLRELLKGNVDYLGNVPFEDFIQNASIARAALRDLQQDSRDLSSQFRDLASIFGESVNEMKQGKFFTAEINKNYRAMRSIALQFRDELDGINDLSSIEAKKLVDKTKSHIKNLELLSKQAGASDEIKNRIAEEIKFAEELLEIEEKRVKELKEVEKRLGLSGKLIKGLGSLPGIGKFIDAGQIEKDMMNAAKAGSGKLGTLAVAAKGIGKQVAAGLADPLTLVIGIFNAANKADIQATELAKSLSLTKDQAFGVREQFAGFSREIGDTAITTDKLYEAFGKLSKQLGFNVPRSKELLAEFTKLTTKMGVNEESAAGLSKLTLATGKNARAVTTEALETAQALQAQSGIQLDNREILNDTGKVSGQLLANFKGNPKAIAEAVTQTKLLGTTLEQTKAQAESLLNFETSIENELKAELLTGRELNLENARMAALKGDQASVAKELANQAMDFNAFSELNVIQQKALAEGLGTSADALSDQLLKQQMMGKSRAEVVAIGGEEAAQRLEQLAAQDKFNNAVEKLKDLLGNLVAGPLGQMLDVFGNIIGMVSSVMAPFMWLYDMTSKISFLLGGWMDKLGAFGKVLKGITGIAIIMAAYKAYASLSTIPVVGVGLGAAAAAAITAAGFGLLNSQKADDMVGYGARTLITPQGSVALNNNDTVIAGTNLFRGDDVISYPKNALSLGGGKQDNTETNNLLKQLIGTTKENNTKPGVVNMDGKVVGSTLVQGSYKLA
jgi:hypothetical protein